MATREYIGARYVPKFYQNSVDGSTQWQPNVVYEPLIWVTLQNSHMYISKKQVPATVGTPAENIDYWLDIGSYNGFIESLQDEIDEVENDLSVLKYDIIVAADGSGDYTSLATAVTAASTGQKIFVKSGTYSNEVVNCLGKELTIVGADKHSVIVQNDYDDYTRAPIMIGKGNIANITFKQNGTTGAQHSYAVHADYDEMANSHLEFYNCNLYSASNPAVGMGTRTNCDVVFRDCKMECGNNTNAAIFIHPSTNASLAGTNQNVTLIDCILSAYNYVIQGTKVGAATNISNCTFISCQLLSRNGKREKLIYLTSLEGAEGTLYFARGAGNSYAYLNQDSIHDGDPTVVGRWDYQPVKKKVFTGSCSANVMATFAFPSDCAMVISMTGYVKESTSGISYLLGSEGDATQGQHHTGMFVESGGSFTGYINSHVDGTYLAVVEYYASDDSYR